MWNTSEIELWSHEKFGGEQNPAAGCLQKRARDDLDDIDRERKDIIGDSSAKCQSIMHEPESFAIRGESVLSP